EFVGAGNTYKLTNKTPYTWRGAGVIAADLKNETRNDQQDWIGDLGPGESVSVHFSDGKATKAWSDELRTLWQRPALAGVELEPLVRLAQDQTPINGVTLVGWLDEEVPGLTISPVASQTRFIGFVVARLRYPDAAKPERDHNTRAAIDY